jgi:predicted phosphodiesterase
MKIIKKDLGKDFESIEIVNMGDLHVGDAGFDEKLLDKEIKKIKDIPNRFVVLNGDLINNAIRHSVSDIYTEQIGPHEQLDYLVKRFEPIKHKILGISQGNHEFRTYRETGIDIAKLFAASLGKLDCYDPEGGVIFASFGMNKYRPNIRHTASLYFTHIGGTKAGLLKMADVVDVDIYFRGHYHNVETKKMDVFRTDKRYKTIRKETKVFVQNGACLKYGGYSQMKGFAPGSSVFPVVKISVINEGNTETLDISVEV